MREEIIKALYICVAVFGIIIPLILLIVYADTPVSDLPTWVYLFIGAK